MVLYENDLISIFVNVYVNLQKWRNSLRGLLAQGRLLFTIHLAPNKCPYVYNLRHLVAGNLSLYKQGYRNSAHSAYSIANRTAWSPTVYAHPAASHAHCVIQI